jgi:hypothetical protein
MRTPNVFWFAVRVVAPGVWAALCLTLAAPAPARAQAPGAPPATETSSPRPGSAAGTGAEPAAPPAPGANEAAPKVKVERGAGGKKVYRITEEIRIEGKIQKPEAFFFYQKSSINYEWQELKQDFVPKILDSVSRAPF